MTNKLAEQLMQYAIDAQHSDEPWQWWEYKFYAQNSTWKGCDSHIDLGDNRWTYRRKATAPVFEQKERVCEWWRKGKDAEGWFNYKRCEGRWASEIEGDYPKYCSCCGGKVAIKEKMCTLAGVEFPVPLEKLVSGEAFWVVSLESGGMVYKRSGGTSIWGKELIGGFLQATETGAEQQLKAMKAALQQAIEAAK